MQEIVFFLPPDLKISFFYSHCLLPNSSHHKHCAALSCVCRRCIKGRPGSSWPQRMTIVSCVMPPSVHRQLHRPTTRARTTPRNYGSLRPNRTPLTCGFKFRNILQQNKGLVFILRCVGFCMCFVTPLEATAGAMTEPRKIYMYSK